MAIHAIALLDGMQGRGMLGEQALAAVHAQGGNRAVEVFPHRPGEFRLTLVGTDHRWIGDDAGKGALEGTGLDAGSQRLTAEGIAPFAEAQLHHGGSGHGGLLQRRRRSGGYPGCGQLGAVGRGLGTGAELDQRQQQRTAAEQTMARLTPGDKVRHGQVPRQN
ncbi:hypothetical protein D3C80_1457460 [compost metagenome]